jgi:hypothetical protein
VVQVGPEHHLLLEQQLLAYLVMLALPQQLFSLLLIQQLQHPLTDMVISYIAPVLQQEHLKSAETF